MMGEPRHVPIAALQRVLVALAVFVTGATGCARPVDTLESIQDPVPRNEVVIRQGMPIRFGDVLKRQQQRILQVQVALSNTSSADQTFEYRWEWTDADGFQLGDTLSSWQPGFVAGGGQKLLTNSGPGPSAVNFRLYIR
jgi:uncharacterized protein YcfL